MREIFISYSHQDRKWLETLNVYLKPLVKDLDVTLWSDREMLPGTSWKEQIGSALSRASVAVLLVSADYLASDWLSSHELPPLLERAQETGLILVWIPIGHCLWEKTTLAHFQAAWDPSRPLSSLSVKKRNDALVKIVRVISDAVGWRQAVGTA